MLNKRAFEIYVGHPDDWEFFDSLTHHAPREVLYAIVAEYRRAWSEAEAAEPVVHRKTNAARRAANINLREDAEAMKAKEPEVLRKYREIVAKGPPRVCHTCDHYLDDGSCRHYNATPPADFAATPNACPDWLMAPPF